MTDVLFLWHMHQPYYVNPLTKTAMMPWVRLHAVKGYLDMIDMVRRHPDLRASFNFTPVLLKQLLELSGGEVSDLWEQWSRKPAEELSDFEKARILENFFKIHWDNLIMPFPRYRQLLELRGRNYDLSSLPESIHHFTAEDYRDLQTWFNLAWCGFSALKRYPELAELRRKGSGFTEEEKNRVLDIHHEIVAMIPGLYRKAQDAGQIEITTTPFFHPIMPLVYDTDLAKRCMPGRTLPPRFSAPDDVRAHLRLAQEQHAAVFGRPARGVWPSEGSVCPEILPLLKEAGLDYFCTDEGVLFRGLADEGRAADHLELFQVWACEHDGVRVHGLFRERPLSDFIGFNAARNSAQSAADHLRHHLEHLDTVAVTDQPCVLLALDGENAWESFADGGEQFLELLYTGILKSTRLRTRRLQDSVDEVASAPVVKRIHTGSWINSDFDIWIGDPEENKAWEWIGKTRDFLVARTAEAGTDPETAARAWMEIYAAEGSDWFWWYGPDFQTDCDFLFDELFRTHLQNVYRILGAEPPGYLDVPICLHETYTAIHRPSGEIEPPVDGSSGSFYDWLGAGHYDIRQQQTAMFQADRLGTDMYYGFGKRDFYFRLDLAGGVPGKVVVHFHSPAFVRLVLEPGAVRAHLETSPDGVAFEPSSVPVRFHAGARLVAAFPREILGWGRGAPVASFMVQVFEGGLERERYPERGLVEFPVPTERFHLQNWFV
jgi:alpha-amylase/alpha-mannosidase (GH57 family)